MTELPILIAGGGIGGLTAAVAIAQAGRDVTLLERAAAFEPIGYGIQIGPNALHTFERLGLLDEILAYCSIPDEGILSDAINAETLMTLPMGGAMVERFGQPYAVIHRADLHQVLIEACTTLPQITLRNNFDVVRHDDLGDNVSVEARTGETMIGAMLIGADGIWSTIRRQLFPDVDPPFTSRYAAFRCVCPIGDVAAAFRANVVNLRCGTNFHMIHYPLRRGTLFNLVGVTRVPEPISMDDQAAVIAHFEQTFAGASEEVRALVPLIDKSRYWAVSNLMPMHEWVRGRVALIGDAAHAMVQAMAQGACQAIEDGYVLAKHLASGADVVTAAMKYQSERHIRATHTQYRSLYMWELIHATGGWRDLRREKLGRLSEAEIMSQLEWLYSAAPDSDLRRQFESVRDYAPARHVRSAGVSDPSAASAIDR